MAGAGGNLPALKACLADAASARCDLRIFLGGATGPGTPDLTICAFLEASFDAVLPGAGDPAPSHWRHPRELETEGGRLLLCHGSPRDVNTGVWESRINPRQISRWLDEQGCLGLLCAGTGLAWVRGIGDGRFAVNVGSVGRPDNDGDPAVHYAVLEYDDRRRDWSASFRRVVYDHEAWADYLEEQQAPQELVSSLRTGRWPEGLKGLPMSEIESRRSVASERTLNLA